MENLKEVTNWVGVKPPDPALENNIGIGTEGEVFRGKPEQSVWKETTLLPLLPEEIWLKIFQDVEDKKDWESCCMASSHVCSSLSSTKPLWRFTKAISSIAKYLRVNDLLNCRLVCTQWREDMDNYLPSSPPCRSDGRKGLYYFKHPEEIRNFLQKFSDNPRNPILDRNVNFIINACSHKDVGPDFDAFMTRFGDQIWYMQMWAWFSEQSSIYNYLHIALTKTTELELLRFEAYAIEDYPRDIPQDVHNAMSASFIRKPLPFIPTLQALWLEVVDCDDAFHSSVMLPYATQLRCCTINMMSWKDFYARGLANLTHLIVQDICSDRMLKNLLEVKSPIERMTLTFGRRNPSRVSMVLVLEVLAQFPLREVSLKFGEEGRVVERMGEEEAEGVGEETYAFARIRIPKVKKLRITQSSKFCYNFLNCFPNLESLKVELLTSLLQRPEWQEQRREEDIKFYEILESGGGSLYESNIWKKLRKLKSVRIFNWSFRQISGGYQDYKRIDIKGTRREYDEYRAREWVKFTTDFL